MTRRGEWPERIEDDWESHLPTRHPDPADDSRLELVQGSLDRLEARVLSWLPGDP